MRDQAEGVDRRGRRAWMALSIFTTTPVLLAVEFVVRLRYAYWHWPIEHPMRWVFNRRRQDNPDLG